MATSWAELPAPMMTTLLPALFFAFVNLEVWIISPLKLSCVRGEDINSERPPPSNGSTHLSFKVWHVGVSDLPGRNDDVCGVKDPRGPIRSAATDSDVPLPLLTLADLLHKSRSPYIQFQRLGVEFQPFTKLTVYSAVVKHNPATTKRTLGAGK